MVYDGTVKAVTLTGSIEGVAATQIQYVQGETEVSPKNAGTYTAKLTVDNATATLNITVTARALTLNNPTVVDKDYDGTNTANVTAGTPTNKVEGDDLTVSVKSATYDGVNVGSYTVTVTYELSGAAKDNYTVENYTTTANIKKATAVASTVTVDTADCKSVSFAPVTVTGINGTVITDATVEYAISNTADAPATGWQNGLTFEGLAANTEYYAFVKVTGKDNYNNINTQGVKFTTVAHDAKEIAAVIVTKTKDGNICYYKCNSCGKIFLEASCDATTEVTAVDVIVKYQPKEATDNQVDDSIDAENVPAAKPEAMENNAVTGIDDGINEDNLNAGIANAFNATPKATKVELKVINKIVLNQVESDENGFAKLGYSVTPYAQYVTFVNDVPTYGDLFKVENDMFAKNAKFAVTLSCAGMGTPKCVVHKEKGVIIDVISGDDMVFNPEKETVTVKVGRFSELIVSSVMVEMPAARLMRAGEIVVEGTLAEILAKVQPEDTVKLLCDCGDGSELAVNAPEKHNALPISFYIDSNGFTMNATVVEATGCEVVAEEQTEQLTKYTIYEKNRLVRYETRHYFTIHILSATGVDENRMEYSLQDTLIFGENGLFYMTTYKQNTSDVIRFKLEKQDGCTFDEAKVTVNGIRIYPDGDGVYTVDAGKDDVVIVVMGAVPYEDSEEELNIWEKIYKWFRSIIQSLCSLFRWGSNSSSDFAEVACADVTNGCGDC